MELEHWICVIDLFGVSYDGTLPSIALACDETCWVFLRWRCQTLPLWSLVRTDGFLSLFENPESRPSLR
jgi:hypothetical protein